MTTGRRPDRLRRSAKMVPLVLARLQVSDVAERDLRPAHAQAIADNLDPEKFDAPHVSLREDGHYYIVDGAHRAEALRLLGWADEVVACWTYEGLTLADEARLFLDLSNRLAIRRQDRFAIRVNAGEPEAVAIDRIVRAQGLTIGSAKGSISSVASVERLYGESGGDVLARTVRMVDRAFGENGLRHNVILGVGLVCNRYNGQLDEEEATEVLAKMRRGALGLEQTAHALRAKMGRNLANCVASAVVDQLNTARRGRNRLPSWFAAVPAPRSKAEAEG